MAWYAYKDVVNRIPKHFTDMVEGYEGLVDYDGDAWTATSYWINALEARIKELETQAEADRALAKIAAVWLRERATGGNDPRLIPLLQAAADNPATAARARELAQEGQDGTH